MNEKIEQIRERITNPPDLVINRVPKNTLDRFKQLASVDEFSKDYGMTLKHLIDVYVGLVPTGVEHLESDIEALKVRLSELENKGIEKKNVIRTLDGAIIHKR